MKIECQSVLINDFNQLRKVAKQYQLKIEQTAKAWGIFNVEITIPDNISKQDREAAIYALEAIHPDLIMHPQLPSSTNVVRTEPSPERKIQIVSTSKGLDKQRYKELEELLKQFEEVEIECLHHDGEIGDYQVNLPKSCSSVLLKEVQDAIGQFLSGQVTKTTDVPPVDTHQWAKPDPKVFEMAGRYSSTSRRLPPPTPVRQRKAPAKRHSRYGHLLFPGEELVQVIVLPGDHQCLSNPFLHPNQRSGVDVSKTHTEYVPQYIASSAPINEKVLRRELANRALEIAQFKEQLLAEYEDTRQPSSMPSLGAKSRPSVDSDSGLGSSSNTDSSPSSALTPKKKAPKKRRLLDTFASMPATEKDNSKPVNGKRKRRFSDDVDDYDSEHSAVDDNDSSQEGDRDSNKRSMLSETKVSSLSPSTSPTRFYAPPKITRSPGSCGREKGRKQLHYSGEVDSPKKGFTFS